MRGLYRASPELKAKIAGFCCAYAKESPRLNAFAKIIRDLLDEEAFFLLQGAPETAAAKLAYETVLARLNGENYT